MLGWPIARSSDRACWATVAAPWIASTAITAATMTSGQPVPVPKTPRAAASTAKFATTSLREQIQTIMHRALAEQGIERPIADYMIYGGQDRPVITGRLVGKGMHDELSGEAFAAGGASWLDHQLLVRDKSPLSEGGFGREVREALQARVDHLASEGLVRRDGNELRVSAALADAETRLD